MPRHQTPSAGAPGTSKRLARALRWAAVVGWAALIFAGSSLSGSQVPGRYGPLGHFAEYAVLGMLAFFALKLDTNAGRAALFALVLASGYAITDELHQAMVPGRVPDPADWAVDFAGALTAVWILYVLTRTGDDSR